MKYNLIISVLIISCFTSLAAQESVLVNIDDVYPREIIVQGFELPQAGDIEINASGIHQEDGKRKYILGTCWILSAESREVVWRFTPDDTRRRKREPETQKVKIELPPGIYEVYYASYPYINIHYNWDDYSHREHGFFGTFFEWLFGNHRGRDGYWLSDSEYHKFHITVRGVGKSLARQQVLDNQAKIHQKSFINIQGHWDEEYEFQGFEVTNTATVQLYAIGELREDGQYDYGWIVNTENRERVWEMDYRNTEHAGGANKNRQIIENITLEPGRYAIYYVTDDSHSPQKWNAPPPYDPYFWGITLSSEKTMGTIKKFDYEPLKKDREIISLTRMRDDQYESEGFSLNKSMQIHVYAIGEGRSREMFDYGWIIDANTRETVWEMTYRNTVHAGGALKNRLYDGIIQLPAGNYIAGYLTDGSHSYRHWNDSPPLNSNYWGLTLLIPDGSQMDRDAISAYKEEDDPSRLAVITRVRNHEHIQEKFSLTTDGDVRIYAVGEGLRGKMYDYAWIEDLQTGRVVWEMTYRMTNHAGGAKKNRSYNDVIRLEKGDYQVVYETDDSHAYNSWNDSPPIDPAGWGIIISKVM